MLECITAVLKVTITETWTVLYTTEDNCHGAAILTVLQTYRIADIVC